MCKPIANKGYLKIDTKEDQAIVANVLFKNGYTVQRVRGKKNGKSYEYFIKYEMNPLDMIDEEAGAE